MKINRSLDLIFMAFLAFLTLLVALLGLRSSAIPQTLPVWFFPVGILMVLYIPGYVLVKSVLPVVDRTTIFLLAMSMSVALNVTGILVLNALPWGLQPTSWAVWTSGFTLLGCAALAIRRYFDPAQLPPPFAWPRLNLKVVLPILVALGLLLAAVQVSLVANERSGSSFTQFWALPLTTSVPYEFQIGIRNDERQIRQYNIYVESRGMQVYSEIGIELDPKGTWTTVISLSEKPTRPVNVYLYLSESPEEIYRDVHLAPDAFDALATPTNPVP